MDSVPFKMKLRNPMEKGKCCGLVKKPLLRCSRGGSQSCLKVHLFFGLFLI